MWPKTVEEFGERKWLVVGLEEGHLGLWTMFHLSKSHMQTHEVELSIQYNRKFKSGVQSVTDVIV